MLYLKKRYSNQQLAGNIILMYEEYEYGSNMTGYKPTITAK